MEDVNQVSESQDTEAAVETVEVVSQETPQAGDKTPPNALLESLQKERAKRRELEETLLALQSTPTTDAISDEGRVLQQRIESLEDSLALKDVSEKYPALKDKTTEFDEFRKAYPKAKMETIAKLFLAENDLIEPKTPRKGLEKATGGQRQAPQQGLSVEDVTKLRTTNFRKYMELVKVGKINT